MPDPRKIAYDDINGPIAAAGTDAKATFRTSIGLGSVDNTADADKPVSTAQAAAIALKADIFTGREVSSGDATLTLADNGKMIRLTGAGQSVLIPDDVTFPNFFTVALAGVAAFTVVSPAGIEIDGEDAASVAVLAEPSATIVRYAETGNKWTMARGGDDGITTDTLLDALREAWDADTPARFIMGLDSDGDNATAFQVPFTEYDAPTIAEMISGTAGRDCTFEDWKRIRAVKTLTVASATATFKFPDTGTDAEESLNAAFSTAANVTLAFKTIPTICLGQLLSGTVAVKNTFGSSITVSIADGGAGNALADWDSSLVSNSAQSLAAGATMLIFWTILDTGATGSLAQVVCSYTINIP